MGITKFDEFPAEIKVYIFRLATIEDSQLKDTHLDYRPFEAIALHWHDRDWASLQQGLDTKRTIVLVSKEWKKIATEMLYECIRVHHGTDALIKALEGPLAEEPATIDGARRTFDNGRWVRRVEISPDVVDFDPFNPFPLLEIIQSCPLAETVVRQCACSAEGLALAEVQSITFPMFPNIKRIDWWLPSLTPASKTSAMDTGLPGFLRQLIDHCPNLQYLTLSGFSDRRRYRTNNSFEPIHFQEFASIRTLRLEGEVGSVPLPKCGLSLPRLQNLVLAVALTPNWPILRKNGHRVRVLELINHNSYDEPQAWSTKDVLALCPNIEEFCFSLDMCDALVKQNEMGVALYKLKCLRLKLQLDHWSVMQATQIGVFVRDKLTCPALERIVLHGKEDEWRENESFPMLESYLEHLKYVTLDFASL